MWPCVIAAGDGHVMNRIIGEKLQFPTLAFADENTFATRLAIAVQNIDKRTGRPTCIRHFVLLSELLFKSYAFVVTNFV